MAIKRQKYASGVEGGWMTWMKRVSRCIILDRGYFASSSYNFEWRARVFARIFEHVINHNSANWNRDY